MYLDNNQSKKLQVWYFVMNGNQLILNIFYLIVMYFDDFYIVNAHRIIFDI